MDTDSVDVAINGDGEGLPEIGELLRRLESISERGYRIVECRVFEISMRG